MGGKPLFRFEYRFGIAVDRSYVCPQSKKGGAVSAAPQCAVEYRPRAPEDFDNLIREHRRVIGAVPRARCSAGHRQKRRI